MELSTDLRTRGIHPTFHVSLLRKREPNDDLLFPHQDARPFYDMGIDEEQEWLVNEIIDHRWTGNKIESRVKWTLNDTTWES